MSESIQMKMVVNVEGVTYDVSAINYRPQTKFAKVMFLQVSVCPQGGHAWLIGGVCMVAPGGHAWLLPAGGACVVALGGMHGFSGGGGACMVALRGGHAWLLPGGHV